MVSKVKLEVEAAVSGDQSIKALQKSLDNLGTATENADAILRKASQTLGLIPSDRAAARIKTIETAFETLKKSGKESAESIEKAYNNAINTISKVGGNDAAAKFAASQGKAFKELEVSAGQTAQALRTLPAQFTDIAVSLQGGQSPLTVLLQQGGQIKDQFGGIGSAVRAMGGYISSLISPLTVVGAAAAAFAFAMKQAADESERARNSTILGGASGAVGDTVSGAAANVGSQYGVTVGKANEVASAFAQLGVVAPQDLEKVTNAAIQLEKVGGASIEAFGKNLTDLAEKPAEAFAKISKTQQGLTLSTLETIKALEDQGKMAEAAALAQEAYASAAEKTALRAQENLTTLGKFMSGVGNIAKEMWDKIVGIGREDSLAKQLANAQAEFARNELGSKESDAAYSEIKALQAKQAQEQETARKEKAQKDGIAAQQERDNLIKSVENKQQSYARELALERDRVSKINAARAAEGKAGLSSSEIAAGEAAVRKKAFGDQAKAANEATEILKAQAAQIAKAVEAADKSVLDAYNSGFVDIQSARQARLESLRSNAAAQKVALDAELQDAQKRVASAADPNAMADAKKQVIEIESKIVLNETNLSEKSREIEEWARKAKESIESTEIKLTVDFNKATGIFNAELARKQLDEQYREVSRKLASEASSETNTESERVSAQAALDRIEILKRIEVANQQAAQASKDAQIEYEKGAISSVELEMKKREAAMATTAALQEQLIVLEQQRSQLEANGETTGEKYAEVQRSIEGVTNAIKISSPRIVDLSVQIKNSFLDNIGGAIENVLTGTTSLRDGMRNVLAQIASDILKSGIRQALLSQFSGGDKGSSSIFGSLASLFGGSSESFGLDSVTQAAVGLASGGPVSGPGSSTSDSIPARLSNGEYVIKASSVRALGLETMHAINSGVLPQIRKYATGGLVTAAVKPPQNFAVGGYVQHNSDTSVNVQVINQSSQPVSARSQVDPKSGIVQVILEDLRNGGAISRSINQVTGTSRYVRP